MCDCDEEEYMSIDKAAPTLTEWIEEWEAAVEAGQSCISREEAKKRYHKEYGE
jgi:hypothetical protein